MLAEELEVGLDQVRLEHAPPNEQLYASPVLYFANQVPHGWKWLLWANPSGSITFIAICSAAAPCAA